MSDKKQIHLKAGNSGRVELLNGSIHVAAEPGQTVLVDDRQHRVAMRSGYFANGPAKGHNPAKTTSARGKGKKTAQAPGNEENEAINQDPATPE